MSFLKVAPWALTALLLLVLIPFALLVATGAVKVTWASGDTEHKLPGEAATQPRQSPYAIPGRLDGTTAFYDWKTLAVSAPKKVNASYPPWFKGKRQDGLADEASNYFYQELVGPKVQGGLQARGLYSGLLVQKRGTTYPSHNHPAAELYYILEGDALWWVDDESKRVGPGTIVYHRPLAVHGWEVIADLKAVWIWWAEGRDTPDVLNQGARLTNWERDSKQENAKPFAHPLPTKRTK